MKDFIRMDEHGAMRIADSGVSLDSVVIAFEEGHSAETICAQYPALTLEEAYGAITFYLGHREEVKAYLERQAEAWAKARARSALTPSPVIDRLRAIQRQGVKGAGNPQ